MNFSTFSSFPINLSLKIYAITFLTWIMAGLFGVLFDLGLFMGLCTLAAFLTFVNFGYHIGLLEKSKIQKIETTHVINFKSSPILSVILIFAGSGSFHFLAILVLLYNGYNIIGLYLPELIWYLKIELVCVVYTAALLISFGIGYFKK